MKTFMILAMAFALCGCIPDNSGAERKEADRQEEEALREMHEQEALHKQRSQGWGYVGKTEEYEGFR